MVTSNHRPTHTQGGVNLRRKLIIGTALIAVLAVAGVAYAAALNNYTAKIGFSSSKPGTAAKPVPLNYAENLTAANTAGSTATALRSLRD